MTRVFGFGLWLAILPLTIACGPKTIPPAQVSTWDLRGSVESISPSRLDVRHKSGRVIDLAIDERTEILGSSGQPARSVIVPGMRVDVRVETDASGAYRARSVRVFN